MSTYITYQFIVDSLTFESYVTPTDDAVTAAGGVDTYATTNMPSGASSYIIYTEPRLAYANTDFVIQQLLAIDQKKVRATSDAILSGSSTKLQTLENIASQLRTTLANIS